MSRLRGREAERLASGDPRPSLEERYGSQEGYTCAVRLIAKQEVRKRFLLQADADRLVEQAAAANILPSDPENRVAKRLCALEHLGDHFGDRDEDEHHVRHRT